MEHFKLIVRSTSRGGALSPIRLYGSVVQQEETEDLKSFQYGFESHWSYQDTAVSFNGRTALSKSANVGPIPTAAAIKTHTAIFLSNRLLIYKY